MVQGLSVQILVCELGSIPLICRPLCLSTNKLILFLNKKSFHNLKVIFLSTTAMIEVISLLPGFRGKERKLTRKILCGFQVRNNYVHFQQRKSSYWWHSLVVLFKWWSVVITAKETCTNIYFSKRNVYLLGARKNAVIKPREDLIHILR